MVFFIRVYVTFPNMSFIFTRHCTLQWSTNGNLHFIMWALTRQIIHFVGGSTQAWYFTEAMKAVASMPLVFALVPFKCSSYIMYSRNLQFPPVIGWKCGAICPFKKWSIWPTGLCTVLYKSVCYMYLSTYLSVHTLYMAHIMSSDL